METRVIRKDTLEELEQAVAAFKAEGWSVRGEGVPFWEDGQHGLEMERPTTCYYPQTHWIADFTGEERASLNDLSDLCGS